MMPFGKKPVRAEASDYTSKSGRYFKKDTYQPPHGSDFYRTGNVIRHPTALRRSDQMHIASGASSSSNRSARSLSVPSLHTTNDARAKYSPPLSPPKQRSKSVRGNPVPAKKTLSFKKLKKLFGSHSELDEGGGYMAEEHQVTGTYRPLNSSRPRSIGGSSDCSSSSVAHSDFSRCNSLRDSSRSRISGTDSVFHIGGRQASLDANDYPSYPNHTPSNSTDSSMRLHTVIGSTARGNEVMPRSNSSASLKNFGVQPKIAIPDPRHFSIAVPPNSALGDSIDERGLTHRKAQGRPFLRQGTSEDTESLWEDSQSFTYVNQPVVPSDPEYRQIAKELMSASPTRKNSNEFVVDPRRMSDASVDPRRVSNDSGVESSIAPKHNRSLPSTPITQTFNSTQQIQNGGSSTPPEVRPTTPHGYLSQESEPPFPSGWDLAYTPQGLRYYIDHNSQSTHWKLPTDVDDSLGLPEGWEAVKSKQYGTYYVNHHNKTAIYQHPYHSRPPPPYHRPHNYEEEEPKLSRGDRRTPARSHSHRSTQTHRVLDPNASLPRRSKSFRDQESQDALEGDVSHARQLSTMTFVPPSPYQIKEIPPWLKQYVEAPLSGELHTKMKGQWPLQKLDDLTAYDTMIKRLLKKASEQVVKQYEYYRVAIQQETEERARQQARVTLRQQQLQAMKLQHQQQQQMSHHQNPLPPPQKSPHTPRMNQTFNYPPPPSLPPPSSHIPHPHAHPSQQPQSQHPSSRGGIGVTSSGAYFDPPPPSTSHHLHEHNHFHHHPRTHPASSPNLFSHNVPSLAAPRHHSSSNLQQNLMGGAGGGVSSHHGNQGSEAPNRTQSYNNLPHVPANGHMFANQGQQLHAKIHPSSGSKFADIFESKVSHSDILQDLEETFV